MDSGIEAQPVERFHLTAALGRAHVDVRFTQRFAGRHSELAKITSAVAKCDGSKWRVTEGSPRETSSSDAQEIDSHVRFVRWLRATMVTAMGGRCVPRRRSAAHLTAEGFVLA